MNAATQTPPGLHRAAVLNTLLTKTLSTVAPMGAKAPNPATLQRPGHVEMDEGRPWSGDRYDEGAISDPGEAYAAFGDGGDVEAWLDKGDDGVLIGWVREGDTIYRYSDAEAWGIDVDGAGMGRTDGGASSLESEQIPEGAGDELAAGGEEMLEDASTADASIGDLDPVAFEDENDEAVEEGDPTDPLEDPTNPLVEEVTGDGGPDAQGAFADMLTDDTLPDPLADPIEEEPEDPTADPDAPGDPLADPDTPGVDPVLDPIEETAVEGTEAPDPDDDAIMTIAPDDLPTADDDEDPEDPDDDEDEDEDDEDEEGKKRSPFQSKHHPGEHNQETHGNRVSIGMNKPRASRSTSADTSSATSAAPSGTSAPATPPQAREAKKVALSTESIAAMADADLEAIMEDGKVYDDATMMAAAAELDERNPLDDKFKDALAASEPGSLAEHNLLRDVLPADWIKWAATDASQRVKGTKGADREDEWLSFVQAQYLAALDFTNGQMFRARFRGRAPFGEMGFFDGTVSAAQAKKYMSRELQEWWDNHGVTKTEFMNQFSDNAGRKQQGKRTEMYT